jgi:hypothetical protein
MGWLTGWTYRKSHIINPASGAGQNYQKRIVVHYGAGVDSDEEVYLDSKCKTDFGDIRFTDSSGTFLLDYWIEKKVDSNYAICWVEIIDDLSVYDKKIYTYYSNAGVTSIANGDNTFVFFDDFEVDLSKWLNNHASISTDYAYNGSKCLRLDVVGGSSGFVSKLLTQLNVAIHTHYYDIESAEVELHALMVSDGAGHDSAIGVVSDGSQYEYMPDAFNPVPINSGIDRTIDWHEFIIRCHANDLAQPWLGGSRQFLIDGIVMSNTTLNYANIFLLTSSTGGGTATGKSYWDTVFITKYINPEPAHGTWGSEEDDGVGITTFNAEDIVQSDEEAPIELEDIIYSLSQSPELVENVIYGLLKTPLHVAILSEDILVVLNRLKTWLVEDIMVALTGSLHVPVLSENILVELLRIRICEVAIEFGISEQEIVNIIMTTQGELLRRLTSKLYEKL